MINDSYRILGVNESSTDDEIYSAYYALRQKYREQSFTVGADGNEAAKKMTELDAAYEEICEYRREHGVAGNGGAYTEVDAAIRAGDLEKAQRLLDGFNERPAEWHYLQAVVFYKKNWMNESRKQLEIAKDLDPTNEKYKTTYDKLVAKTAGANGSARTNDDWNKSGSGSGSGAPRGGYYGGGSYDEPQMGGDSCFSYCCQLIACNALLNCCCNCR